MNAKCEACGSDIDVFDGKSVSDAWQLDEFDFYDVKCECGETQVLRLKTNDCIGDNKEV